MGGAKIEYDWNNRPKTVKPFGSIAEEINRFMIVADTEFNQCSFVNTKTFNLRFGQPDFKGGWKHELRGGTNDQFHSSGFTFPHEVIAQNDFGDLHLVFNTKSLQNTKILGTQKF
ncbi:MAG: hypothetical protein IPN49_04565 [Saprospiraceae bacterium]|nr:hypothetical protein [Saprospiraceae bacterium]